MGEKDLTEKTLLDDNRVFSDVINTLYGSRTKRINPGDLRAAEGRSQYKFFGPAREQERDIIKRWKGADIQLAMIGLENQTSPDPTMPYRCIGYDGASYRNQIPTKNELKQGAVFAPVPVVTVVLYLGYEKRWNTNKSLSDGMTIPDLIAPLFQDYRIHLVEVAWLDRKVIDSFQSDFWILADYLWQMRTTGNYRPTKKDRKMNKVSEVLSLFRALTGDERFVKVYEEARLKGKKGVRMCEWLDRIEARGVKKGERRGERRGITKGTARGIARSIISTSQNYHIGVNELILSHHMGEKLESAVREELIRQGVKC